MECYLVIKNEGQICATIGIKLENIMPHERSCSERITNYIITFIGNFQSRQIYKGQKQISDCQRPGRGDRLGNDC